MPAPSCYARSRHRYRRWVASLVFPVLLLSCTRAVPRPQTVQAHGVGRDDIRRQIHAKLEVAAKALAAEDEHGAADALIVAEFPLRTEQDLFSTSELVEFKRRAAEVRTLLDRLSRMRAAEDEIAFADTVAWIERQREVERSGLSHTATHFQNPQAERDNKWRTVAALHQGAAESLRNGDYARALGFCRQLIVLDPGHPFDDAFWANVQH